MTATAAPIMYPIPSWPVSGAPQQPLIESSDMMAMGKALKNTSTPNMTINSLFLLNSVSAVINAIAPIIAQTNMSNK